jgi:hypothetical protein
MANIHKPKPEKIKKRKMQKRMKNTGVERQREQ